MLPELEISSLFSDIELLENVNNRVREALNEEYKKSQETGQPIMLGPKFLDFVDCLKMYTNYCANQPLALQTLDRCQKKYPTFSQFIRTCMETVEACRGLSLLSFLIKPVQRICKYPLLLRDLIKNTRKSNPDYQSLSSAFSKIEQVVDYVNEKKRHNENLQKCFLVQEHIEGGEKLNLVEPSRFFIKEGMYHVTTKGRARERRAYFFNDMMVITKPRKSLMGQDAKDHFKGQFLFNAIRIIDHGDTQELKNACEISNKSGSAQAFSFIFVFPTAELKRDWVKDLKQTVKKYQEKEALEKKKKQCNHSF